MLWSYLDTACTVKLCHVLGMLDFTVWKGSLFRIAGSKTIHPTAKLYKEKLATNMMHRNRGGDSEFILVYEEWSSGDPLVEGAYFELVALESNESVMRLVCAALATALFSISGGMSNASPVSLVMSAASS